MSVRVEIERPFTFAYLGTPHHRVRKKERRYHGRVSDRKNKLYVDHKIIEAYKYARAFYIAFRNWGCKMGVREGMTTIALVQEGIRDKGSEQNSFRANMVGSLWILLSTYGLE